MQHDHPLTLRPRAGSDAAVSADAEVVTLTDDGTTRATLRRGRRARRPAGRRPGRLGVEPGDRVGDVPVEHPAPPRGLPRHPVDGRGPATRSTCGSSRSSSSTSSTTRRTRSSSSTTRSCRCSRRSPTSSRPSSTTSSSATATPGRSPHAHRATRTCSPRARRRLRLPRASTTRSAAGALLHERDHRQPQGRPLLAPLDVLHSIGACTVDASASPRADRVLPVVPMFHANAWGLPYAAVLAGADLVMPDRFLQAEPLGQADRGRAGDGRRRGADDLACDVLQLRRRARDRPLEPAPGGLRRVGRAAVAHAGLRRAPRRQIIQAWGMTETSPLATVAHPPAGRRGRGALGVPGHRRAAPSRCVEVRIIGDDGEELPWDGESTGELEVRGPWVAARLLRGRQGAEKFHDGWLRTGDIASIDDHGFVRISDRSKDVIKSGGEWISSVELENELMAHPDVEEAAVIAMPDERWAERPLACVVLARRCRRRPRGAARAPAVARGQVVAARRVRVHRRGAEDLVGQVRQEGPARPARRRRARGLPAAGRRALAGLDHDRDPAGDPHPRQLRRRRWTPPRRERAARRDQPGHRRGAGPGAAVARPSDLDAAVRAAREALPAWRAVERDRPRPRCSSPCARASTRAARTWPAR